MPQKPRVKILGRHSNPSFGNESLQGTGNPGSSPVLPHLCLDTKWKIWFIPVQETHVTSQKKKKKSGITLDPKYLDSGLELAFTLNALNVSIFSCNCKCFTWVYLDKNHLQETKHKRGVGGFLHFRNPLGENSGGKLLLANPLIKRGFGQVGTAGTPLKFQPGDSWCWCKNWNEMYLLKQLWKSTWFFSIQFLESTFALFMEWHL